MIIIVSIIYLSIALVVGLIIEAQGFSKRMAALVGLGWFPLMILGLIDDVVDKFRK